MSASGRRGIATNGGSGASWCLVTSYAGSIAAADGLVRNWMDDAVCADRGNHIFFTGDVDRSMAAALATAEAKALCMECPVTAKCLTFALEARIDDGVWGGTSAEERRNLRRRKATAA